MDIATTQKKAREAIQKLIPGIDVGFPGGPQTAAKAEIIVNRTKRGLTINSFANAAKKLGWIHHGTKSATNRNDYIALYVTVDSTMELYVKSVAGDSVFIEARQKV